MANGIVGLKPTYGRVSRYGVHPLGETLDHVGPMTRSVADAAIVLEAIAGHDINDPTSLKDSAPDMLEDLNSGVAGMRIGYDRAFASEGLNAGLVTAIENALSVLENLGASIVDVKVPVDPATIGDTWFAICSREAFNAHANTFPSRADEYGMHFREFLEIGASITDDQYAAATEVRNAFNEQFNSVLGSTDTVICPAGGFTLQLPPEIMYGSTADLQPLFEGVQMHFTIPADFAGTPALTLPCGFADNGIPYAMQLRSRYPAVLQTTAFPTRCNFLDRSCRRRACAESDMRMRRPPIGMIAILPSRQDRPATDCFWPNHVGRVELR
jgi:amidase